MAKGKFKRKLTTIFSSENKTPTMRSSALRRFLFSGADAGLILFIGFAICQCSFLEKPYTTELFVHEIRCSALNVVVRSPYQADALIACEGARDAMGFLASQGLELPHNIAIDLLARLPAGVSESAAGCCVESERRALILVYSGFKKFNTWFGVPIDRSLYRSLVSHEVAHLVAAHNFRIPKPSIPAKEYVAYITQFETMEPGLRDSVLSHFPCEAFEGERQMNTIIYMFDCMRFGVRAYRHYLKLANRREYLQSILDGKSLVE
jgi:hypothetical protein